MLTNLVIWLHDGMVNSGLVDRFLAGDTHLSATIGVLVGSTIGWNRLTRTRND